MSISVCPCHLANIAASNANDGFSDMIGLNLDHASWKSRPFIMEISIVYHENLHRS